MDLRAAANHWRDVWQRAWPAKDAEAIVALYAPACEYRALVLREPALGPDGVRDYLHGIFAEEDAITCRFGEPLTGAERAAVEWWASWVEGERTLTMAGVTLLRFDDQWRVSDHRDYWNDADGRSEPFAGW